MAQHVGQARFWRIAPRLPASIFASWKVGLAASAAVVAALTALLAALLDDRHLVEVSLIYLLWVLVASAAWGYAVGLATAAATNVCLNFFFVPPLHRLTVQQPSSVVELVVFLLVALIGASMLALLRRQRAVAEARRTEAVILYRLAHELTASVSPRDALARLCLEAVRALSAANCSLLTRTGDSWRIEAATGGPKELARPELVLVDAAWNSGQTVRLRASKAGSQGAASGPVTFCPFPKNGNVAGALRIGGTIRSPGGPEDSALLSAFATEASLAVQRMNLAAEAARVEALQRSDEMKTAVLSSVSHDLKSPLTAIMTAADSLLDESTHLDPADQRAFFETIRAQAGRLSDTVSALLEMSRLEGGAVTPVLEAIEVAPLLEDVRVMTADETRGRDVVIAAGGAGWLRADYVLVFGTLRNLLVNAASHSRPEGRVFLEADRRGPMVGIHVRDEGPGIPLEDLPHVFEKFFRGTGNRSTGSGLGLSIVKAMTELCGGRVSVRSGQDGAVFTVTFPAAVAPPEDRK